MPGCKQWVACASERTGTHVCGATQSLDLGAHSRARSPNNPAQGTYYVMVKGTGQGRVHGARRREQAALAPACVLVVRSVYVCARMGGFASAQPHLSLRPLRLALVKAHRVRWPALERCLG